jgi:hypothetical protein
MTDQSTGSDNHSEISGLEIAFHHLFKLIGILRWPATIVFCTLILSKTVPYLAGENTTLDIAFKWIGDIGEGATLKVSLAVNLGLIFFWRISHRTQRDTIARLGQRNTENERLIDPNRSSSGLALDGTTHPRDRLGG